MSWDEYGINRYDRPQEPAIQPVDDLTRFIADRIREIEVAAHEAYLVHDEQAGAMAHRYAGHVRADMIAFRKQVVQYLTIRQSLTEATTDYERAAYEGASLAAIGALSAIAERWGDHPDFREDWRVA
jgi:hypothetical protein